MKLELAIKCKQRINVGDQGRKTDIGKVIGKLSRTAAALRTILNAVSTKEKKHTLLEIIE